jgi:hypothetical protein
MNIQCEINNIWRKDKINIWLEELNGITPHAHNSDKSSKWNNKSKEALDDNQDKYKISSKVWNNNIRRKNKINEIRKWLEERNGKRSPHGQESDYKSRADSLLSISVRKDSSSKNLRELISQNSQRWTILCHNGNKFLKHLLFAPRVSQAPSGVLFLLFYLSWAVNP